VIRASRVKSLQGRCLRRPEELQATPVQSLQYVTAGEAHGTMNTKKNFFCPRGICGYIYYHGIYLLHQSHATRSTPKILGPQNYAKALQHYNRAIQLKPEMPETYEYRGVLFAKMGRKADAEKDLATLKKLNPKLAGELEQFLKTGREVEEYGGTSPKQNS
jgi:tetratricopeptide (TPR) repeat protein